MKKSRVKFVISGWYGFGNLGDEVILQSMASSLDNALTADITVLSFNPVYTSTFNRLKAAPQLPAGVKHWLKCLINGKLLETLKAVATCDILILGGGGFLSDWQPEAPWVWLRQALLAKVLGKKVMLYGIGAGPFSRRLGKCITRTIINRCIQIVTVRDEESRRWLLEAGVKKELIRVTADPAVNYPVIAHELISPPTKIGICVASVFHLDQYWPGKQYKYERYIDALRQVVVELLQHNFEVVFIPMHAASDIPFAEKILQGLPGGIVLPLPENIDEAVAALGQVDILVTMRYHAAVLGAIQGVPVAGIIYHHKVAEFLERIGMGEYAEELGDGSNWRESDIDPERLVKSICHIAGNHKTIRNDMLEKVRELQQCLEPGNIKALKELLGQSH